MKLSHHDGSPLYDERNPVIIRHGFSHENSEFEERKYMLQRNGLIPLTYYPPINATTIGIEVNYLNI